MGLRSFVALPVEKGGVVVRLENIYKTGTNKDILIAKMMYGIDAKQTILIGTP